MVRREAVINGTEDLNVKVCEEAVGAILHAARGHRDYTKQNFQPLGLCSTAAGGRVRL